MKPLVSIITPYLNAGEHFRASIASVEAQTTADWELLLIDDGSRDQSRMIADQAAARDSRIKSLVRPDDATPGAAGARNWGLAQSTGQFVVFLDADDCFLPAKIEVELALMERHPTAAMVVGACIWWYPNDEVRNWCDRCSRWSVGMRAPPWLLDEAVILQRLSVPCITAVMVRRSELPGPEQFETDLALYEDQTLLVKLLADHSAYLGRHIVAVYRQHDRSVSSAAELAGYYQRTGPHVARDKFLDWIENYLNQHGSAERSSWRALRLAHVLQGDRPTNLGLAGRAALLRLKFLGLAGKAVRRVRNVTFGRTSWRVGPFS